MNEKPKRSMRHLDVATLSPTLRALNPHLFMSEPCGDVIAERVALDMKEIAAAEKKKSRRRSMNKTEEQFQRILQAKLTRGELQELAYEPFAMPIEGGMTYTPDFVALPAGSTLTIAGLRELFERPAIEYSACSLRDVELQPGAVLFFETKGRQIWDKNKNKWKQARDRYRWGKFEMWQLVSGEWNEIYSR